MPLTAINLDGATLDKLAVSAKARSLSQEELLREIVNGIYEDDAMLAKAVEKSRAEIARGEYFTQEQVEEDGLQLIRQIDNLA